jgi:hypothetical protein
MSGSRVPRVLICAILFAAVASSVFGQARTDGALIGKVSAADSPLPTTLVYAYQTDALELRKVLTDRSGVFLFDALPAGLYKIIAVKPGFLPAVVMLTRTTAGATQFLEMELSQESTDPREAEASFWRVREQIPVDVLRDLDQPVLVAAETSPESDGHEVSLRTEMRATSGIHEALDVGEAQVNGAQLGLEGQIRSMDIEFLGTFAQLESHGFDGAQPSGSSQALLLEIGPSEGSRVAVASHSTNLNTFASPGAADVDFERHRLSYSKAIGRKGHSDFSAQYVEESNYYRQALIRPAWIPSASRAWRLEGSYSTTLGQRSTLEAGMRYRDRESEYARLRRGQPLLAAESVEIFGRGGVKLNPTVVVQYGLYSAMRDGDLSLVPQGGVVLNLGRNWKASTLVSRRIEQEKGELLLTDFTPVSLADGGSCLEDSIYCYEVELERAFGADDHLSVAAVHRKVGDTQRLFFDGDFLDRFDSLYLVEGDQLPELRVRFTRRLTPGVVATLSSNLATGGGGLLKTNGRRTYENEVSFLVTSLDAQFEETSTGVYLAFHRLEQELNPIRRQRRVSPAVELERLQLGVRQDLDLLRHLATELALHLNMELSRGDASEHSLVALEELRKRITGGFAVRF